MSQRKRFTGRETAAYGLGAIGKDMVYALSSSYVMYYYQDILGLSASFVGLVLLLARIFDAVNDPFMGVVVAKTHSKWGRFRPWILCGTVLNAFVLYALFAAPDLSTAGLMIYFPIVYVLWGVTYTMMDIPYWSMIPAVTDNSRDREHLSVVGRTCAGIGSAIITVLTVMSVAMLGGGVERAGFRWFALIVSILFIIFEAILFVTIKEKPAVKDEQKTATIKQMFKSLFANDQALVVVMTIVLTCFALYITSNLIIYFFKYDIGGAQWQSSYTLFTMIGGVAQILGMMILYPLLRKRMSNTSIFRLCLCISIFGYFLILFFSLFGLADNLFLLCIPGVLVFSANGMISVLTTVFLSNSVDYGELKTGRREESVIFSMQTFVYKASSGLAVFVCGIGIDLIGLTGNDETAGAIAVQSAQTLLGLRLLMTILPIIGLFAAYVFFRKKFKLTDEKADEMALQLKQKHEQEESASV